MIVKQTDESDKSSSITHQINHKSGMHVLAQNSVYKISSCTVTIVEYECQRQAVTASNVLIHIKCPFPAVCKQKREGKGRPNIALHGMAVANQCCCFYLAPSITGVKMPRIVDEEPTAKSLEAVCRPHSSHQPLAREQRNLSRRAGKNAVTSSKELGKNSKKSRQISVSTSDQGTVIYLLGGACLSDKGFWIFLLLLTLIFSF